MSCEEIRDNLRINVIESRQSNRSKILGSKRNTLQDVVNLRRDVTETELIILANKLKNKSALQVEDLALLKLSFLQRTSNIVSFLKLKGAVHGLVRELSSRRSNYQLVSAECCCNLALGDSWSCLQVAKAAGPYLIALLHGCNYNLISTSVWALGNLVGSDENTWEVVRAQGFLGRLLQLIREHDTSSDIKSEHEVQQNSLMALAQFLRVGFKLLTSQEIESIANTVASLTNIQGKGVRVCEYLLSCIEAAEKELLNNKVHVRCLHFLENTEIADETINTFTPALRTVANLVAESSGVCALDIFSNWNLFHVVVQKIFVSPYPHLVSELGWLLGNLLNHSSVDVQTAVQNISSQLELYLSQFAFCDI